MKRQIARLTQASRLKQHRAETSRPKTGVSRMKKYNGGSLKNLYGKRSRYRDIQKSLKGFMHFYYYSWSYIGMATTHFARRSKTTSVINRTRCMPTWYAPNTINGLLGNRISGI